MLFKILKVFGLDVPTRIEAAKTRLELRVERVTDWVRQVAQVAALFAVAIVLAAMAAGVGLLALYRWTAEAYGEYVGLGVVGALLVAMAAVFASVAAIKAKSLARSGVRLERAGVDPLNLAASPTIATAPHLTEEPSMASGSPIFSTASASDLVEPLSYLLSKGVKFPTFGNPAVEELVDNLRMRADSSVGEAIDRAANVIRHGDRLNLAVVLTGATTLAWLLTYSSRR